MSINSNNNKATILLKWPLDLERPERSTLYNSFVKDGDFIVQHVEDLEDYNLAEHTNQKQYFNYLRDGFLFKMLKKYDFDYYLLKDDFSIQFMLYIIHANLRKKPVYILSHGIKHSASSAKSAAKKKIFSKYFFLNIYRFSKLFMDCLFFSLENKIGLKGLYVFFYFFTSRLSAKTYLERVLSQFNLTFDFYCLNYQDINIQQALMFPNTKDLSNVNFKIMDFPYHNDLIKSPLAQHGNKNYAFVFLTAYKVIEASQWKIFFNYLQNQEFEKVILKLHPFDYGNLTFQELIKKHLQSAKVEIRTQMSDELIANAISQSRQIYSFYSTIIIPILAQRKIVLITPDEDVLDNNITANDFWSLGLIDILYVSEAKSLLEINNLEPDTAKYKTLYGLSKLV